MSGGHREWYRGRRVLVTGGLGFIGSNLARALVDLGADVHLVDALIPDDGGNRQNIAGIESQVRVTIGDVRDAAIIAAAIRDRDVVFNLAGQVSHVDSMRDPLTDLDINCRSQVTLLEACRRENPGAVIVYAGTRQIYGRADRLPVDETHPVRPVDVNGINKAAGEAYHLVYHHAHGLRTCSLRLTNVYGPRQLLRHNRQGFIGWFIRIALEGGEIPIYGDGSQVRDFVYVDDAVDAFLRVGATDAAWGEVFNVGGGDPIAHRQLVEMLLLVAGRGTMRFVEWPEARRRIDIGSFYTDASKLERATGWHPTVSLRDGLTRTLAYYRTCLDRYIDPQPGSATA